MTIYLVTMPDSTTSRWNEKSIEMAKRNHRAILNNPNSSPEARERARAILQALEQARPIEDDPIASGS